MEQTAGTGTPEPPPAQVDSGEDEPSRLGALFGNRKRLLIALGLLLLAAAVAVGSTAVFTSSSANPSNTFTAGTLSQSNDKDNAAILTATKMVPGDTRTGRVTIQNNGDVSGKFTLTSSNLQDTPGPHGGKLSDVLQLKIMDGATVVYNGPYNSMPSQDLGTWSAGQSHTYDFTVTFPQGGTPGSDTTGDNAYEGSSTSITFNWNAVST
jgi:spore coat-associated protein N